MTNPQTLKKLKRLGMCSHPRGDKFTQKIEAARHRVAVLGQLIQQSPCNPPERLTTSCEELQLALEELQVAEEHMRQQHEALLETRQAVEAERQRYQELFESAPDGYLVTDADGIIGEANRAAAEMLNIEHRYLISKPLSLYITEEDRKIFRSQLNQLKQGHLLPEWEVRVRPRYSEPFYAAVTMTGTYDPNGELETVRWLLRDITIRKQVEAQIRSIQLQNVQLEEASRVKSQFLAMMSHEMRTPMNAILGFSQLLLRHPHIQLGQNQANMIERIFNSGKHLLRLIEDILDYSMVEAGRLELHLEEFNLAQLITDTTEEHRCLAEPKNLTLYVQSFLTNPQVVNDKLRLQQVLVNLLSNAIKFTDSGSVWVEVWEVSPDRLSIAVKDTGIGIAESDLKHIFQEFRQLNESTTRQHGGTGLGLAITDRLVRLMKGRIKVESQLGQGSTFCVEFPRQVNSQ